MEITVECNQREEGTKPNALRRQGLIPAALYGHDGTNSVQLTIPAKALETLMKKAVENKTVVQLNVADLSWSGKTLIKEIQVHPWKGYPYHVSFFSVGE
ncbi:MAG: 50S ribosomal protein L25 [Microcoleaceae cyanobacterium]